MPKQKKTQGVEELVTEILKTIPEPYSEDIIEDVCLAIERGNNLRRYNGLVNELNKHSVNCSIGKYTMQITGLKTGSVVTAKRSKIIKSYSKCRCR